MLTPDMSRCRPQVLELVDAVAEDIVASSDVAAADVMIVGAQARDILHGALGHEGSTRTTSDVDVAIAVRNWSAYNRVVDGRVPVGDNGVRYRIAGVPVDVIPFGAVEEPPGRASPRSRPDGLDVRGHDEAFRSSPGLPLPSGLEVRLPAPHGFVALKMYAWLDRSQPGRDDYRDAYDLGLACSWYASSAEVADLLYGDAIDVLLANDLDLDTASVGVLSRDVAALVGTTTAAALALEWREQRPEILRRQLVASATSALVLTQDRAARVVKALGSGLA